MKKYPITIKSKSLDNVQERLRIRKLALSINDELNAFAETVEHGTHRQEIKDLARDFSLLAGRMNGQISSILLDQFLEKYGK